MGFKIGAKVYGDFTIFSELVKLGQFQCHLKCTLYLVKLYTKNAFKIRKCIRISPGIQ